MTLRERDTAELNRALDDQRVMPFDYWCAVNGFSRSTGRRLVKSGNGPRFTQLSERRSGVTVGNNREWQKSRERG
jgi:hypothetical protein